MLPAMKRPSINKSTGYSKKQWSSWYVTPSYIHRISRKQVHRSKFYSSIRARIATSEFTLTYSNICTRICPLSDVKANQEPSDPSPQPQSAEEGSSCTVCGQDYQFASIGGAISPSRQWPQPLLLLGWPNTIESTTSKHTNLLAYRLR